MDDASTRERELALLEDRRLAYDGAMWQAPTLMLVAQAFLLTVLTDSKVSRMVAVAVATAGIVALGAAGLALAQLHDRERHFSGRIRRHAEALGMRDPRRFTDRHKRHLLEWRAWLLWEAAFLAFLIADAFALQSHW